MKTIFNWNTFRTYLQEEVSEFEYRFLKRVFSQAALSFGGFGLAVCMLSAVSSISSFSSITDNFAAKAIFFVSALVSGVALMFYYLPKYHSNPMDVTPKFVRRAYITLMITYGAIFITLFKGLELIGLLSVSNSYQSVVIGGSLFGAALLVYAVPAGIGFFMQKHNTALKLSRFLKYCYLTYLGLFLIGLMATLITLFSGSGSSNISSLFQLKNSVMMLLYGVIVFVSPILSVYRMKMVTRFLDQKDPVAIKKWELFFVFEILVQLMQMAIYIFRVAGNIALSCLGCTNRR